MLTIWGRRSSFNLQKVMWLAGGLELPHTHIPAGGDFGLTNSPEFLAMNPHGRVPVIDGRHHCLGVADDPALSGG
jgi:glutathione S-transferase